jgi:probable F420-dependent oxidoreductase
MRFHFADAMIDPALWVPLARELEAAGYDGMTVPDSLCYPEVSDSTYPYTPDGDRGFLEDKPFLDPFVQIGAMGAVTERLRFTTFVLKLPVRHPVLTAKLAASVATLTNGRLDFGVGVSPWPDDYRVTGVPWEGRGKRMDECIEILRGLWTGDYYAHEGEVFQIESIKMSPAPPAIPILIGGHTKAALRRAAQVGDGWLHAGGDPKELERMIAELQRLREEAGRSELPFDIRVISLEAYMPEGIERLASIGVTDVIVGFRNAYSRKPDRQSLQEKVDAANMYAERIIRAAR